MELIFNKIPADCRANFRAMWLIQYGGIYWIMKGLSLSKIQRIFPNDSSSAFERN
jgi:hypothetical protein